MSGKRRMDFLNELSVANKLRNKEWDPEGVVTLSFRGNELAGEVGEVCNEVKKLERIRLGIRGTQSSKERVAEEMADVLICLSLLANDVGVDLKEAVIDKFNKTSEKYGLSVKLEL